MNDDLITAKNATLKYAGRMILNNINFSIKTGEIALFIGPNGGGKTSLIKMLLGLNLPSSGVVERHNNLSIAYVPQRFEISAFLPLQVKRLLNLSQHYTDTILSEALQSTQCEHLLYEQIKNLSGGELQRVLLARAMLSKPDLLVLDEPLQGVDQEGEAKLNKLISDYSKQYNTAIIMVSHNLHLVMKTADKVYCINGHICCHGKPEQVTKSDEFKDIFGGYADQFALYHHQHGDHCHQHGESCNHE